MELTVATHVGFCFGVRRAVAQTEKLLETGKTVCTLGPVIHNPQIVAALEARGARVVSSPEEIPPGATALIRAHGVGRDVIEALVSRGVEVVDATCPFVKRIHALAGEAARTGCQVLVIGDRAHPEVQGILGWSEGRGIAIETEADASAVSVEGRALVVAQTTITPERFERLCGLLKARGLRLDIRNTICQTTPVRQKEAADIARRVDVMLVIGGKNSSNTRRLYEL